MATLDELVVKLSLNKEGFDKGVKETSEGVDNLKTKTDKTAKDLEQSGKRAAEFFGQVKRQALALASVFLGGMGVKEFVTQTVRADAATGKLALIQLAISIPSIPYNPEGFGLIMTALADPIQRAKDFGAIRSGVTLSALQIAQVNSAAGTKISDTIYNNGWYLQVRDPGASARVNRTSPSIRFWYTDGGSVHEFVVASVEIQ